MELHSDGVCLELRLGNIPEMVAEDLTVTLTETKTGLFYFEKSK